MNAGTYKQTVVKDIFRDNVKIEAWISNFMQITASTTDSGSRSGNALGIFMHADPLGDMWDGGPGISALNPSSQTRTFLGVVPFNRTAYVAARTYVAPPLMLLTNLGITNVEGLSKYTLECSQGFVKGYINDTLIQEVFLNQTINAGRVGLWTTNPKFICTRFIVYAKCQKIKLDSGVTGVKANDIVYETGAEYTHKTGDRVIKLYSQVVDPLNHTNLAFAYRGFSEYQGDNAFPYIYAVANDGTAKQNIPYGPAGDFFQSRQAPILYNQTYHNSLASSLNMGGIMIDTGSSPGPNRGSITLDFTTPTTFSNVAFIERWAGNVASNFSSSLNGGNTISGSNDALTWFPLTSSIDIRGRHSNGVLRDYQLSSPVVYRYVRLETQGVTNSNNPYAGSGQFDIGRTFITSFVVRNLQTASIQVNNASDLNVGDRIAVLSKSAFSIYPTRQNLSFRLFVSGSSSVLENSDDYFIITAKSASVLTLNRFIPYTIDKDTFVFKLNKTVNFTGSFSSGSTKTGRIIGAHSGFFQQRFSFKNVGMQFIDDGFPFQQNAALGTVSITIANFFSPSIIQGCSFYNSLSVGNGWNNNNSAKTHLFIRHNVFNSVYTLSGIQKSYNVAGGYLYNPYPFIFTGNYIYGLGNQSNVNSNYSLLNSSYNIWQSSVDYNSVGYFGAFNDRVQGAYFKVNRNLYNKTYFLSYTPNMGNNFPNYYLATDALFLWEIKNNKINSMYLYGGGTFGAIERPITNLLLADKQSLDFNYVGFNTFTQQPFTLGSNVNPGIPVNYTKNYNRYGYNIWTNYQGHIIKFNNDSWYRHYMYNSINYKTGFMSAQIQILEDVTSSFELSFDYYNDNSQIAYSDMSFTSSLDSGIQVPNREKFAGALSVYVIKNGVETALRILPKSAQPQSYYEKFIFDGPGHYIVALGTSNRFGFIALRNINSKFIAPPSEKIMVKSNPFTMKYFENTVDKLQIRTSNNYYPPTAPSKFRLRSKKPF
jgi:hypothetical protein